MGELQKDIVGQFGLNNWYQQRNNEATLQLAGTVVVPVQEMLKFQRRFRTRQFERSPIAGQFFAGEMEVPRTESWKFHYFSVLHNDSAPLKFTLSISPSNTGFVSPREYTLFRDDPDPGVNTPLIESISENPPSGSLFKRRSPAPFEVLPGDVVRIVTAIVAAANPTITVYFRYEILPPPVILETDTLFSGQTL